MPLMDLLTSFFSGTRRDLPGYWQAANEAVAKLPQFRVLSMENSEPEAIAGDHWSRKKATAPSVVVLLVGDYYGNVAQPSGRSLTELEFDTARQMGIEVLAFRTPASDPRLVEGQAPEAKEAVRRFHGKIDSSVFRGEVRTPDEFAAAVARALQEWERRSFRGTTLSARDFYEPLLRPDRIAGHTDPLLGRDDALAALDTFVQSNQKIFTLIAPWGQGKSRVLLEWARRTTGVGPIRFVRVGVDPVREDLELSGADPCVLILEDAHRRSSALPGILEFIARSAPQVKLVVTTRPSAEETLDTALRMHGFNADERARYLLPPLAEEDHRAILRGILGDDEAAYRIYQRTKGNILAGVLAARLVQRGKLTIASIESSSDFSFVVLGAFKEAVLEEAGSREERGALERLLAAVAAAAPVDPESEEHCRCLAEFIEERVGKTTSDLQALEDAGLLIRGGRLVTLAVDGVADLLLEEACIRNGRPTGYAEKAFQALWPVFGGNTLRNLGSVQWKLNQGETRVRLLDQVWPELEALYQTLPVSGRIGYLSALRDVAQFDPRTVTGFVARAIDYGLGPPEEIPAYRRAFTVEQIHDRLARILSTVLFDPTLVGQVCDLLWRMASDDSRGAERNPDSAERVLREAGDYSPHHSLDYLEAFLNWVAQRKPGTADAIPGERLAVYLKPLLGKEMMHTWYDGRQMTMSSTGIRLEAVRGIRLRALDILSEIASGTQLRAVGVAIPVIGETLTPSVGYFGREVSSAEQAQWEEEQKDGLTRLREIARTHNSRGINLCILKELSWAALHSESRSVRDRARRLQKTLRSALTGSIELAVAPNYVLGVDISGAMEREHSAETQRVAQALSGEGLTAASLKERVGTAFSTLEKLGLDPNPLPLLHQVALAQPVLAKDLATLIVDDPVDPLAGAIHGIVGGILERSAALARSTLEYALSKAASLGLRSLGRGLGDPMWATVLGEDEVIGHLRSLTNHADVAVRIHALWTLGFAGHLSVEKRAAVLLEYDLSLAPETGEHWAEAIMPTERIYAHYSPAERAILARKLRDVGKLGHWSVDLMAKLGRDAPEELVDTMIHRLLKPGNEGQLSEAVPSAGQGNPFNALPREARKRAMEELGALLQGEDVVVAYHAQRLFAQLAEGDPSAVQEVRGVWTASGDPALVLQAARSFRESEPEALFSEQEFVVSLIRAARKIGGTTFKSVRSILIGVTYSGLRQSAPGEPSPRDVAIRDQARAAELSLADGSPERQLYREIVESVEERLRNEAERDRDRRLRE
jgi:hypothetical protein